MIEKALGELIGYAVNHGVLDELDIPYVRNRVLEVLRLRNYDLKSEVIEVEAGKSVDELLVPLLDDAASRGLIDPDTALQRDLWDTAIMGCFVEEPRLVIRQFWQAYEQSPSAATTYFHDLSVASNYIRIARTERNPQWRYESRYGEFEITINTSKPEKDPRDIAALVDDESHEYPACLLCRENEGYAGGPNHPARQNLRLIPLQLDGDEWLLQYSPYRYYPQHCIVLSHLHTPMQLNNSSFRKLADFVEAFPHYLIGSNADIPIVGGSILSHDHFQGGEHIFPMDRAKILEQWSEGEVDVAVLDWPLTVVRLTGAREEVLARADQVLDSWRTYSDEEFDLIASSNGQTHNSITPIMRAVDGGLRLDLVLRNNRTSQRHPDGIFHPHAEIHPIKRENIGLIEVLGLAVLPARLVKEFAGITEALEGRTALSPDLSAHQPMVDEIAASLGPNASINEISAAVRNAAADYFVRGLEHCGVFGNQQVSGVRRFLAATNG